MRLHGETVRQIPPTDIEVIGRARALDENAVEAIMASIGEVGQITTPVHLRKTRKGLRLIDGLHRVTAARRLQLEAVPALVWDCKEDEARFIEVDANLSIAHLQPIDVAISLAERKRAYEKLHPETRQHVAGATATNAQRTNLSVAENPADKRTSLSFAEYAARVLDLSDRQVRRMIAAGSRLTADEQRWLRAAPHRATYSDLEAIAKEGDQQRRTQAIISFSNGTAKNVRAALKSGKAKPVKTPVEVAHEGLVNAFRRAPMAAKRRFVRDCAEELQELLDDDFASAVKEFEKGSSDA